MLRAALLLAAAAVSVAAHKDERPRSWTGFYVGLNAGYGRATEPSNIKYFDDVGIVRLFHEGEGFRGEGGFGGAQLGYSLHLLDGRMGPVAGIVLGIEADAQ